MGIVGARGPGVVCSETESQSSEGSSRLFFANRSHRLIRDPTVSNHPGNPKRKYAVNWVK